jgi:four helix bundle protein
MKESILRKKSFEFSLVVIKEYKNLCDNRKEYVLSKQLLKSGTSIGANIEEAAGAQSKKDFLHKISISYKEARETRYWIRLLSSSGYLEESSANILLHDVDEILRITSSSIVTVRRGLNEN